jgi:hypothetical protein
VRPGELSGPVDYSPTWAVVAAVAVGAVVLYFAAVLWLTREPGPVSARRARRRELRRLDRVVAEVAAGTVSAREGHQQVSAIVRTFVEAVSPLPASSMTLEGLRPVGPAAVTALLDELYEPAFAGDEAYAAQCFPTTARRAREVLTSWT